MGQDSIFKIAILLQVGSLDKHFKKVLCLYLV